MAAPIYCIDTSSILEWFVDTYPPAIFPGILARVEDLHAQGRLFAPRAVLEEIKPGDDCHAWVKGQDGLFIDEKAEVQTIVKRLMATHHNAAKPAKGITGADPFVIAMARDGGPDWIVVSDEHAGSAENRKIPYVCAAERVPCMTFQQLMKAEGWRFA